MAKNSIQLYDTTLRDGEQGEGISFTVEDKLQIVRLLDEFGIHYIEGGQPGSNPKAVEFFARLKTLKLKNAKMAAFGSTCRPDAPASADKNLQAIIAAGTPVATIFGKTWDFHVHQALKISLKDNLRIVSDSIALLKSQKLEVFFDAEHFFDGYKNNPQYAVAVLKAAAKAGADVLVLCDTNGGALPFEVEKTIRELKRKIKTPLGIHAHNDADTAVATSLTAVKYGARQVQGTINGYGERCGNANLCSIIPALQLKLGYPLLPEKKLQQLFSLSHHISEIANLPPQNQAPYVGHSAFAHKAGIHVNAIKKNAKTYEHLDPRLVGNEQRVLISELSGTSNILHQAEKMGIKLSKDDQQTKQLVQKLKELEHLGYQFEEGEASFELLVQKTLGKHQPLFELISYRVTNERSGTQELSVNATLKLKVKGQEIERVASGNGPVSALAHALQQALIQDYPAVAKIHLTDYRVRVLDSKEGTEALVRVIITSSDGTEVWGTVGVSTDIIEASWEALVDSIEYKIK